jgi:hypothetical protein
MKPSNTEHTAYRETRWHLLRVGKHGSLKPFTHLKGLAMFLAGLIFVMACAIGWLVTAWLDTRQHLVASQERVAHQNRAMESIRNEKDGILARLAIAESTLKTLVPEPSIDKKESESEKLTQEKTPPPKPVAVSAKTPAPAPKKVVEKKKAAPAPSPVKDESEIDIIMEKVTADNLFICAVPEETKLNIEFKVINMGTRKQPISGHAFVILKDAHAEQDKWLVVPPAMLMDGRPVQSRGQRFRIYNYRTIKFKVPHENPSLFAQATIFVFKDTGELIFERDFTLEPIRVCS